MKDENHIYEICTLLSSFGQKMYCKKVLNIWPFRLFGSIHFSHFYYNSVQDLFIIIWFKWAVKKESVFCAQWFVDITKILTTSLSTIWENTDGCAEQYRCASSLYLMSVMSQCYYIIIDQGISAPGHGKEVRDGLNAVDKS